MMMMMMMMMARPQVNCKQSHIVCYQEQAETQFHPAPGSKRS